jgi:hypothetical protein
MFRKLGILAGDRYTSAFNQKLLNLEQAIAFKTSLQSRNEKDVLLETAYN